VPGPCSDAFAAHPRGSRQPFEGRRKDEETEGPVPPFSLSKEG
jgi:hypothetical protein